MPSMKLLQVVLWQIFMLNLKLTSAYLTNVNLPRLTNVDRVCYSPWFSTFFNFAEPTTHRLPTLLNTIYCGFFSNLKVTLWFRLVDLLTAVQVSPSPSYPSGQVPHRYSRKSTSSGIGKRGSMLNLACGMHSAPGKQGSSEHPLSANEYVNEGKRMISNRINTSSKSANRDQHSISENRVLI